MEELSLKILLVEDEDVHAKLAERELKKAYKEIKIKRAADGESCLQILQEDPRFDLILLDFSLPKINGLEIMRKILQMNLKVPIILVTGHGNESVAVEAMKLGASDYIIKTENNFAKIPFIVRDSVEKDHLKKEKVLLESKLKESEERFRNLFLASTDSIIILDNQYRIISANPATFSIIGYTEQSIKNISLSELIKNPDILQEINNSLASEESLSNTELTLKAQDGEDRIALASFFDIRNDAREIIGMGCVFKDITQRKRNEERIKSLLEETQKKTEELERLNNVLEEYITGKRLPS